MCIFEVAFLSQPEASASKLDFDRSFADRPVDLRVLPELACKFSNPKHS
jgi:hypothetical protein